jgi:Cu-Zn family superoxide dismutase
VVISAQLADDHERIHGIHIHANDVADNGEGCIADPSQPANTHFVSVDGHYNPAGATHGHHQGDMPALFFSEGGEAWMQFLTDRFQPDELRGRAVILHAASDNYGNVPVGDADDQYTPNSDAATEATAKTGNAGARIACGVIE